MLNALVLPVQKEICFFPEVQFIDIVLSANQEPSHWLCVMKAHAEEYHSGEEFDISLVRVASARQETKHEEREEATQGETATRMPASSSPFSPTPQLNETLLSHPSRLSSRHLTLDTFRIYIKYYMEKVLTESDLQEPRTQTLNFRKEALEALQGFTISYLRHVPELNELASRIVKAAYKAQYREQKRQASSSTQICRDRTNLSFHTMSIRDVPPPPDAEVLRRKTITLFTRTIQELYRDGSVVLWFGPRRPELRRGDILDTTHIWKESRTACSTSRSLQERSISSPTADHTFEDGESSDPEDDNEDAYVPLTRELRCMKVISTLVTMHRASVQMRVKYSVLGDSPLYDGKIQSPSPGEIANWLARDEGWCQVGELVVLDSLRYLRDMDIVYKVNDGRWQIKAEYLRNWNYS